MKYVAGLLLLSLFGTQDPQLIDFATLVERSRKRGWEIVVLDLNVDTTTPNGEAMAGMLAVFGQMEREFRFTAGRRSNDCDEWK